MNPFSNQPIVDPVRLFVMAERWVLVGEVIEEEPTGLFKTLGKNGVVRVWGTTDGLGQIGFNGPTSETKIDLEPPGTRIGTRWILREIKCNQRAWKKWLES